MVDVIIMHSTEDKSNVHQNITLMFADETGMQINYSLFLLSIIQSHYFVLKSWILLLREKDIFMVILDGAR